MGQSPARLARSRAGETSRTNQRRVRRTSPAGGRRRKLRWWRQSVDGRQRAADVWGWKSPPAPSRRDFRGLGKRQAPQVVRSLGCLTARCEECPFVGLQELNPVGDVARVPDVAIKAKLSTQEGGAQFCNQFFGRVIAGTEPILQISINARLVCGPMREFVKCHVVEMVRALESLECRH